MIPTHHDSRTKLPASYRVPTTPFCAPPYSATLPLATTATQVKSQLPPWSLYISSRNPLTNPSTSSLGCSRLNSSLQQLVITQLIIIQKFLTKYSALSTRCRNAYGSTFTSWRPLCWSVLRIQFGSDQLPQGVIWVEAVNGAGKGRDANAAWTSGAQPKGAVQVVKARVPPGERMRMDSGRGEEGVSRDGVGREGQGEEVGIIRRDVPSRAASESGMTWKPMFVVTWVKLAVSRPVFFIRC